MVFLCRGCTLMATWQAQTQMGVQGAGCRVQGVGCRVGALVRVATWRGYLRCQNQKHVEGSPNVQILAKLRESDRWV